jgi:hypothetical protein
MKFDVLALAATPEGRAVLGDWCEEQGRLDVARLHRDQLPAREGSLRERVERLTKAEREQLDEHAQKWIAIGRCTQPADREKAEAALLACYRRAGLDHPKRLVWAPSPLVACLAGPMAALRLKRVEEVVDSSVRDMGYNEMHDEIRNSMRDALCGAVDDSVRSAVYRVVDSAVYGMVYDVVRGAMHDAVNAVLSGDAVDGVAGNTLRDSVHEVLCAVVSDAVSNVADASMSDTMMNDMMRPEVRDLWWRYLGAQFWVGLWWWGPSDIEFALDVLRLDIGRNMELRARAYFALCESCCLVWPHRDFAILCERPHTLKLSGPSETLEQMQQQGFVRAAWEGWEVHG